MRRINNQFHKIVVVVVAFEMVFYAVLIPQIYGDKNLTNASLVYAVLNFVFFLLANYVNNQAALGIGLPETESFYFGVHWEEVESDEEEGVLPQWLAKKVGNE